MLLMKTRARCLEGAQNSLLRASSGNKINAAGGWLHTQNSLSLFAPLSNIFQWRRRRPFSFIATTFSL
jgi:hypothetical protein